MPTSSYVRIVTFTVALVLSGCTDAADDDSYGPDDKADGYDGAMCKTPAVLPVVNRGGGVLSAMEVWTVVWQGDEAVGTMIDHFHDTYLRSSFFSDQLGEYGIGAGVAKGVVVLGPPPADLHDPSGDVFSGYVARVIGATAMDGTVVPTPGTNTVFDFILPRGVRSSGYYHYDTNDAIDGIHVAYTVVPQGHVDFMSDFDHLTWSDTHELGEAATDPHQAQYTWISPAFGTEDEVADLCNNIPVHHKMFDGSTYALSRFYSANRAAAGGVDPCVPALVPGNAYENIATIPNRIEVGRAVGSITTISLVPFSCGTPAPMGWHLYPDNDYVATPDHGLAEPGQRIMVRIRRTATASESESLNVWVTAPGQTDAEVPVEESFAAIQVK